MVDEQDHALPLQQHTVTQPLSIYGHVLTKHHVQMLEAKKQQLAMNQDAMAAIQAQYDAVMADLTSTREQYQAATQEAEQTRAQLSGQAKQLQEINMHFPPTNALSGVQVEQLQAQAAADAQKAREELENAHSQALQERQAAERSMVGLCVGAP
eukprot:scaffold56375_cov19-Tisochrysis_lutea.AAC.2